METCKSDNQIKRSDVFSGTEDFHSALFNIVSAAAAESDKAIQGHAFE